MVHYYLRPTNKNSDSLNSYNKIIEYLMSFVGDIEVKKENENSSIIYYLGSPISAFLRLEKSKQITLSVLPNDNITISLINNIAKNLGLRIYNSEINSYLLNDVNILDLTTIKLDINVKNVINQYHLTPLFQYKDSLIFFAKAKDNSIHLINRHFLEFLISNPTDKMNNSEFSIKIANNINQFIALYDRGLISLTNPKLKIINLSGFDIFKLPKDTKLNIINFRFDEENQAFIQEDTTNKIPKKYLALKIGQDYSYKAENKKLIKQINVSVFNI